MISGYHHEVDINCTLLGYYKSSLDPWRWEWYDVPKSW